MANFTSATKTISLTNYGIDHTNIHYQLSSDHLHAITLEKDMGKASSLGALAINTGEFTGRWRLDVFIVKNIIPAERLCRGVFKIPLGLEALDFF